VALVLPFLGATFARFPPISQEDVERFLVLNFSEVVSLQSHVFEPVRLDSVKRWRVFDLVPTTKVKRRVFSPFFSFWIDFLRAVKAILFSLFSLYSGFSGMKFSLLMLTNAITPVPQFV